MKRFRLQLLILNVFAFVVFMGIYGCKKTDNTTDNSSNTTSTTTVKDEEKIVQHSDDENEVQTTNDELDNEINATLSTNKAWSYPCDVDADNQWSSSKTITFTFNGKNCPYIQRIRTGSITIHLLNTNTNGNLVTKWSDQGAILTVTFKDFKISRKLAPNKYIIFNGTKTYTNVSGGNLTQLYYNKSKTIIHTVKATGITATFPEGQRTWNINRTKTWTNLNDTLIQFTVTGGGSEGNYSNLECWGTNRYGDNFYSQITNPVIFTTACNKIVSGTITNYVNSYTASITYNTDQDGNQLSTSPSDCNYIAFIKATTPSGGKFTKTITY
ncbi:MAG: hypothetical protein Q8880_02955 [Bacteroidota bacterium]|nr:hypothetical protein [Bacteroidota bacterium]